ncbi:hypothetical protein Nepgr_013639 [Nepenthes gracilis]|uniref:Methyl-CpG-binding domain-containing protein 2 n=1 Tax=Nepenthes gracilis TaxID=150966 RepID=A0AAD3SIB9_NEPGR|nr:hypothetical protein Nepgr_013639 [Nepenthes gracilis]
MPLVRQQPYVSAISNRIRDKRSTNQTIDRSIILGAFLYGDDRRQLRPLTLLSGKNEENDLTGVAIPDDLNNSFNEPVLSSGEENVLPDKRDEDSQSHDNASKQLVLYDPKANVSREIEPVPDPLRYQPPPSTKYSSISPPPRVLPSIGAFTIQCANCFKWRLIPTKEKYEEIREHILERPFICEHAREWRPDILCDDPADINQDGSRLWAIDKPNIAQPPPGWERELRIRGEGSSKFADVYYIAPSGKRLRSMVEIQKYLMEHPEYFRGVKMSQFSFQTPKPLQENYVRKRSARLIASSDDSELAMSRPLELYEDESTVLRLGGPQLSAAHFEERTSPNSRVRLSKKSRKTSSSSKQMFDGDPLRHHPQIEAKVPHPSANGAL